MQQWIPSIKNIANVLNMYVALNHEEINKDPQRIKKINQNL